MTAPLDAPKTIVLLDATSDDGEAALDLLLADDVNICLLIAMHGPSAAAVHLFARAEEIDLHMAATTYGDQVAARIGDADRLVEVVPTASSDPVAMALDLARLEPTRRVLVPDSLRRMHPDSFLGLADLGPGVPVLVAPDLDARATPIRGRRRRTRPRWWSTHRPAVAPLEETALAHVIPSEELRQLDSMGTVVRIEADTTLIRQDSRGSECFVVVAGTLLVERDEQPIAELGPGQFVGEMALLTGMPRNADVVAASDAAVLTLSKTDFTSMLDRCPRVARHVMQNAIRRMANVA